MASDDLHIRPPYDMYSPMLAVSRGCTHGQCRFCSLYPEPFEPILLDEVIHGIDAIAKTATARTKRLYLTGGNPYSLSTDSLVAIFDAVEERIPTVNSYGGFCRIMDVAHKSDEELRLLAQRGVSDIALGAESGWDEALKFMRKGHSAADIVRQAQRLHAAGIPFTFFYLAGMAGHGQGQENARVSAKVFSEASPDHILVVTLTPTKERPLGSVIDDGLWEPSCEKEVMREVQTFIANLNCHCSVNCSHDTDVIKFEGVVPENQAGMVELLDHSIDKMNEEAAQRLRALVHHAPW